jgi:hypothetical protein
MKPSNSVQVSKGSSLNSEKYDGSSIQGEYSDVMTGG